MAQRLRSGWKGWGAVALLAIVGTVSRPARSQDVPPPSEPACSEVAGFFTENFDTTAFKDAVHTSAAGWPFGPIKLNAASGAIVIGPASDYAPGDSADVLAGAGGDFTGDGYDDLVGYDVTGKQLMMFANTGGSYRVDNSTKLPNVFAADGSGFFAVTTGDFNGDGRLDVFAYTDTVNGAACTAGYQALLIVNTGTRTSPAFATSYDFTAGFRSAPILPNGHANHLCSVDIDNDGDIDILAASGDRVFLVRNPGLLWANPGQWTIEPLKRNKNNVLSTGFTTGRRTSTVAAADFDGDGDVDIVAGTVEAADYLAYFQNDGSGYFTRQTIAIDTALLPDCRGPAALFAADFDGNGRPDIFGATAPTHALANPATQAVIWMYKNTATLPNGSISWTFRQLNGGSPVCPPGLDVHLCALADYDADHDPDVVLADFGQNGTYYMASNELDLAADYATSGQAWSLDCTPGLADQVQVITRVQASGFGLGNEGSATGLSVTLEVSADDGTSWETYRTFSGDAGELASQTLPVHDFTNFGKHLRWRVSFERDPLTSSPSSTPTLSAIEFTYWTVDRREYARSALAAGRIDMNPDPDVDDIRKIIVAGTFVFPGWQGHLRAYDLTDVQAVDSRNTVLRTVSRSNLPESEERTLMPDSAILWDAGQLLDGRTPESRTVYTAVRSGDALVRMDFLAANAAAFGLNDPDGDDAGLVEFVRGAGRDWKLGDIDHSTPVLVGPPAGIPYRMGDGYEDFKTAQAGRIKAVYVGANDGMLHAFDARDGRELWGFVPYNLLPRLQEMSQKNSLGERQPIRRVYVDGSPVAADVRIGGVWKTVLVCGQGAGHGSLAAGGWNYYFALDVTDPDNPQPLWEFTDYSADFAMGESWSVPAVGKVMANGVETWVAFMGSGYSNDSNHLPNPRRLTDPYAGNSFYAVSMADGTRLWAKSFPHVITSPDIWNTLPASPSLFDTEGDGLTDRVYFADLDGRVYRLDATVPYTGTTSWDGAVSTIYTDSRNYPIVTRPAAWVDTSQAVPTVWVFVGTGGDDIAPADGQYAFLAVKDEGSRSEVGWFLGNPTVLGLSADLRKGSLAVGEKVWADPVVSPGDLTVYFSTLTGNIENVNPCLNLGAGKLYARFIRERPGAAIGGSAFTSSIGETLESLDLASKARKAVTVGDPTRTESGLEKREIYVQEYDSTIQRIEQMTSSILKIRSWREVYKIIR